jgi:uncharacterized protein YdaU (DUF1376 family)
MAKDPAFLFFPNDYIGGTMGMSFEEKGAYIELLMMQFNRGHMTEHMIRQTVGQLWDTIKVKFIQDEKGLYYNKRLEEEQIKRKEFTNSRRNNLLGNNQHTKKAHKNTDKEGHVTEHTEGHMSKHMENRDRNRDIDINDSEIGNINYEEILNLWNHFAEQYGCAKVLKLSESRRKKLKVRLKDPDFNFENILRMAEKQPFLYGENKNAWKTTFDWIIENDKNYIKIMENNYGRKTGAIEQRKQDEWNKHIDEVFSRLDENN